MPKHDRIFRPRPAAKQMHLQSVGMDNVGSMLSNDAAQSSQVRTRGKRCAGAAGGQYDSRPQARRRPHSPNRASADGYGRQDDLYAQRTRTCDERTGRRHDQDESPRGLVLAQAGQNFEQRRFSATDLAGRIQEKNRQGHSNR